MEAQLLRHGHSPDMPSTPLSTLSIKTYHCPIEVTLELVGGKWKPLILWHLKERGVLRNGEFRRLIPTISQKMLTQQLRQLEADGLVGRTAYAEVPPRVEYRLSRYGRELEAMLDHLCDWGNAHAHRHGIAITPPPSCDSSAGDVIG